jgi:4-amino-4-deoxy-L-arabinose transferase-like glycosyltransferase
MSFTEGMVPEDREGRDIFFHVAEKQKGQLLPFSESNLFSYIIGLIYFLFGYFPLSVRIFNIFLSIGGTYLLFKIAKRRFGALTANLFLLIALFLPTQTIYSVTMSKDFVRMFVICLILWGGAWIKK